MMPTYYFDLREDDGFAPDEEGLVLPSLEDAQIEAANSLADAARDALLRSTIPTSISVEVRDGRGPVMQIRFVIESTIERTH